MEILINNVFYGVDKSKISPDDRGLLLGDGVFTTLKAVKLDIIYLEDHITRLVAHAKTIFISLELNLNKIKQNCIELIKRNELENGESIVRITVTRGVSGRGINIPDLITPSIIIKAIPFVKSEHKNFRICYTSIIRNEYSAITKIKSLNYLEPILAKHEASTKGFNDGIMLNTRGAITECSTSNIFFITSNYEVLTPHLSEGVMDGIIRKHVINACKNLNIPILQRSIKPDDVFDCIEAFQTNCISNIQPIFEIEGFILANKKDSVAELIRDYCKFK